MRDLRNRSNGNQVQLFELLLEFPPCTAAGGDWGGKEMEINLGYLADILGGNLAGDAQTIIRGINPLSEARPGDLSFLDNVKNQRNLAGCKATALLVPEGTDTLGLPAIIVAEPLQSFVMVVRFFNPEAKPAYPMGVDDRAAIHSTAVLGNSITIGPFVVVGPMCRVGNGCILHPGVVLGEACILGDNCIVHPHAVLYPKTKLGNRVVIHSQAVLGADGFGYRLVDGKQEKIPQMGSVELGDDVEIGACSAIDRATFGRTLIGDGTKIDNLVQVGHNCKIGKHNLIVSQTGIAGSCTTGSFVVVAGQVGIADHVTIGDYATIGAQSGVMRDILSGERVLGSPGRPEREAKRILVSMERLPEIFREMRSLKSACRIIGGNTPGAGT